MKSCAKLNKIAVFGGSFNPVHKGHINLVLKAQEQFKFDKIKIVPAFQNPLGGAVLELSPADRLDMLKKVFKKYSFIEIDDRELKRGGMSYTIDTIEELKNFAEEIFLIMGMDQFVIFDKWKNFEKILQNTRLLVCDRKGAEKKDILQSKAVRKHLNKIDFLNLKSVDISSSEIRRKLKQGLPADHLLPADLSKWLDRKKFYLAAAFSDSKEVLKFCHRQLNSKKAEKILTFDLRKKQNLPYDFILSASSLNTRHTKTLARFLQKEIKKKFLVSADGIEGLETGQWVVLDYGSIIIHIFYHYIREHYQLENIWGNNITL